MKHEIVKEGLNEFKIVSPIVAGSVGAVIATACTVLADPTASGVETAMTTAASSIATEATSIIAAIIPGAALVMAAFIGIRVGIKAIRSFTR